MMCVCSSELLHGTEEDIFICKVGVILKANIRQYTVADFKILDDTVFRCLWFYTLHTTYQTYDAGFKALL